MKRKDLVVGQEYALRTYPRRGILVSTDGWSASRSGFTTRTVMYEGEAYSVRGYPASNNATGALVYYPSSTHIEVVALASILEPVTPEYAARIKAEQRARVEQEKRQAEEKVRIAAKDAERSERLQAILGISDATARYGNKDIIIDHLLAEIDELQGQS